MGESSPPGTGARRARAAADRRLPSTTPFEYKGRNVGNRGAAKGGRIFGFVDGPGRWPCCCRTPSILRQGTGGLGLPGSREIGGEAHYVAALVAGREIAPFSGAKTDGEGTRPPSGAPRVTGDVFHATCNAVGQPAPQERESSRAAWLIASKSSCGSRCDRAAVMGADTCASISGGAAALARGDPGVDVVLAVSRR